MNGKIKKFDKIFNCQKCDRTLWLRYWKLPDGRIVCPICYSEYSNGIKEELKQKLANEEKEKKRKLAKAKIKRRQKLAKDRKEKEIRKKYIEDFTIKIEEKGLSELIYNFFNKKYKDNPTDKELRKLWLLLKIKHHIKIDYTLFFDVVSNVEKNFREVNDLAEFEKDLMPIKKPSIKRISNPDKKSNEKNSKS